MSSRKMCGQWLPLSRLRQFPQRDNYWRFKHLFQSRREQGQSVRSSEYESSSFSPLTTVLRRVELQLIDYGKCTVEELRKFALDRKIIVEGDGQIEHHDNPGDEDANQEDQKTKHQLVEILEAADEDRLFLRFMDLSAELRCEVYKWYMAGFPQKLQGPSQPPLSKTCRLVRKEFLPLFYQTMQFQLSIRTALNCESHGICTFNSNSDNFLALITAQNLAETRRLIWNVRYSLGGFGSPVIEMEVEVRRKMEKIEFSSVTAKKFDRHHNEMPNEQPDDKVGALATLVEHTVRKCFGDQATDEKFTHQDLLWAKRSIANVVLRATRD